MTESFRILVDIDCLLDTRIGAASMLSPEHTAKVLGESWSKRTKDSVILDGAPFSSQDYNTLLNSGSKDVLKHSLPTLMTNFIYGTIRDYDMEPTTGSSYNKHHVVVNLAPYSFSKEECDLLIEILESRIPNAESVTVTAVPLHLLTPAYLRSTNVTHYIRYDLQTWLDMYVEILLGDPIPSIFMHCPKLLVKEVSEMDNPDEVSEALKSMSPYEAMELQFAMYVALRFIDAGYFSIFMNERAS